MNFNNFCKHFLPFLGVMCTFEATDGWSNRFQARLPYLNWTGGLVINGEVPGSDCMIDEGTLPCICLNSTRPPIDEPPLELLDILSRGSDFLRNYSDVHEAVLMLGNTGVGKTTSTQIIAGDLSKLHVVSSLGEDLFIIDEENRIGLPSTKSKTLFPELITRAATEDEDELGFYDFPGFDDTRGPVQDIAANFFMNEVVKKITSIKMLFLCVHSDVNGDNRDGFGKLADHAVEFVKEIGEFTSSFALVVNKVNGINSRGRPISDATIIAGIAEFLQNYKRTLLEDLDGQDPDQRGKTRNKIIFVETLLTQDQTGAYSRIWFIKNPIDCGPLSHLTDMVESREKLTYLTSSLNFTPVGENVDTRFGFTLKDSTIRNIGNYSKSINSAITNGVITALSGFDRWYDTLIKSEQSSLNSLVFRLSLQKESHERFKNATIEMALNNSDPSIFFTEFKHFMADIGFSLSTKFEDFMYWQDTFITFFDKAANEFQKREVVQWAEPILNFSEQFFVYLNWYDFCYTIQKLTFTSSFQARNISSPSPDETLTAWLQFVNDNIITVSPLIKDILNQLHQDHLIVLKKLLMYALEETHISCVEGHEKALVFTGNFLRLEDLKKSIVSEVPNCANTVYFLASHTIFLDNNFELQGYRIAIVAPNLVSNAYNLHLNFNGAEGETWQPEKAEDGKDGITSISTSSVGEEGCTGKWGGPGSQAFVVLSHIGVKNLLISTNGGKGGKGQHGGHGGNGWHGRDSKCWGMAACGDADTPDLCAYLNSTIGRVECFHYGFNGGDASKGGNGGNGGFGGLAGENKVVYFHAGFEMASNVTTTSVRGLFGEIGMGGKGGVGGRSGKGYHNVASSQCSVQNASNGRGDGRNGEDGIAGGSSLGVGRCQNFLDDPKAKIVEWIPLLQYKFQFVDITSPTTIDFIAEIDSRNETFASFTLKGLAEEALALEKLERNDLQTSRLSQLYLSLLHRLEKYYNLFFNELTFEHQKVLSMLLSSVFASLQTLRERQGNSIIVDVANYFDIVKTNIQTLSDIQEMLEWNSTIHKEKQKYVDEVNAKVTQASSYISDTVLPAVEQAQNTTADKLSELGQQLEDLINDNLLSLDQARKKLNEAERQQRKHEVYKLASMASGLLSKYIPGGDLLDGLIGELEDKYADSSDKIERLHGLVSELREMGKELEGKKARFESEFAPLVGSMLEYFESVTRNITNGNDISLPQLGVTKWQLQGKLNDCKESLEEMGERSLNTKPLVNAFKRLMDAMTLMIDLLEIIDHYQETKGLASYIAVMQSAHLRPIQITDPNFVHTLTDFDIKLKENLLDVEVHKAIHAFKQWIFPFAKYYLFLYPNPSRNALAAPGDLQLRQVQRLATELQNVSRHLPVYNCQHDNCQSDFCHQANCQSTQPPVIQLPVYTYCQ